MLEFDGAFYVVGEIFAEMKRFYGGIVQKFGDAVDGNGAGEKVKISCGD